MTYYYGKQDKTDYRYEAEHYRDLYEAERRYRDQENEERRRQLESQREIWQYEASHVADTWNEAFCKNIHRLKKERQEEMLFDRDHAREDWQVTSGAEFWTQSIKVNQVAQAAYNQEMASIAPVIAKLEAKIEKLKAMARRRVIKTVEEQFGDASEVEDYLLADDPSWMLEW